MEPMHYDDVEAGRDSVAPDGEHISASSSEASGSGSSSSSEVEEGLASPLPNKRPRTRKRNLDPRVDTLMSQMSYISNYLTQLPTYMSRYTQDKEMTPSSSTNSEHFLINPNQPGTSVLPDTLTLALGSLGTDFDNRSIIQPSDSERLSELNKLQQFDSPAWKAIRYKRSLQDSLAFPGFVGLKVNDELCHFNKSKDYLASTEVLLAGLSNRVLEQRQLLRMGLQSILDWAVANPKDFNLNSLFEKISGTFGPGSASHKNSEITMQIICGKRSECIEIRRDRILNEIGNQNLKATLRNVPPSSEHLFSREALGPIIQSLGGSQVWLNTPSYVKDKKVLDRIEHTNISLNKKFKNRVKVKRSEKKFRHTVKRDQPFRQRQREASRGATSSNNKQA